jgi:hypothetical protein
MAKKGINNVKIGQFVAQGDILLIRTTEKAITPQHKEAARDEHNRVVIARGETSGHAHVFRSAGVSMLVREGISDRVVTIGVELAALLHDEGAGTYVYTGEHGPHELGAGTYIARQQREWAGEESQNGAD